MDGEDADFDALLGLEGNIENSMDFDDILALEENIENYMDWHGLSGSKENIENIGDLSRFKGSGEKEKSEEIGANDVFKVYISNSGKVGRLRKRGRKRKRSDCMEEREIGSMRKKRRYSCNFPLNGMEKDAENEEKECMFPYLFIFA